MCRDFEKITSPINSHLRKQGGRLYAKNSSYVGGNFMVLIVHITKYVHLYHYKKQWSWGAFWSKASYSLLNSLMLGSTVIRIYSATRHKFYRVYRKKTEAFTLESSRRSSSVQMHQSHCHIVNWIDCGNNCFSLNVTFCRLEKDHIILFISRLRSFNLRSDLFII